MFTVPQTSDFPAHKHPCSAMCFRQLGIPLGERPKRIWPGVGLGGAVLGPPTTGHLFWACQACWHMSSAHPDPFQACACAASTCPPVQGSFCPCSCSDDQITVGFCTWSSLPKPSWVPMYLSRVPEAICPLPSPFLSPTQTRTGPPPGTNIFKSNTVLWLSPSPWGLLLSLAPGRTELGNQGSDVGETEGALGSLGLFHARGSGCLTGRILWFQEGAASTQREGEPRENSEFCLQPLPHFSKALKPYGFPRTPLSLKSRGQFSPGRGRDRENLPGSPWLVESEPMEIADFPLRHFWIQIQKHLYNWGEKQHEF